MDFAEVLSRPGTAGARVNEFLDGILDEATMPRVVDATLSRHNRT